MKNKCKVISLPTDNISRIHKSDLKDIYHFFNDERPGSSFATPQYIYILSDDEIKDEDYIYHNLDNCIVRYFKTPNDGNIKDYGYKKVIATTNPELIKEGVASIDDEFIKQYCDNPVEEVNIEYFKNYEFEDYNDDGIHINYNKLDSKGYLIKHYKVKIKNKDKFEKDIILYPKLSSNGSIIVKPSEETWDDIKEVFFQQRLRSSEYLFTWLNENYETPKRK